MFLHCEIGLQRNVSKGMWRKECGEPICGTSRLDQVAIRNWIATHRKTTLAEVIIEMAKPKVLHSQESRVPFFRNEVLIVENNVEK